MARLSLLFVIWLVYFKPTQQGNLDESHLAVIGSNSNPKTTFINESVPKECEELGLCENSKQYPKELVRKLIKELEEANITLDGDVPQFSQRQSFVSDLEDNKVHHHHHRNRYNKVHHHHHRNRYTKVHHHRKLIKELEEPNLTWEDDVPQFRYRQGFDGYGKSYGFFKHDKSYHTSFVKSNPCPSKPKTIAPFMIRALTDGRWYYSLNSEDNYIQTYNVKICATTNSSGTSDMTCNSQLILSNEYKSRCIQKWMIRKTIVVKDGKAHTILVNIPSSCSCVAVNK